ncbi:penicillin acylase family protein [Musicola paradisiaca]|uniref:Peptidase S45 penicillin amidase n=1 Tax=Musicola paradisiaca (strain Ech703) TaxID=579405 RepID=C6CCI7_MUSP7|nr:penicillin acylase family protein [Musicola paradisiaca]ACS86830.1 peptidase S45 penicillin amidase [Musicola paradisiaca Ech703]
MKITTRLFERFPISTRFICGVIIPFLLLLLFGYLYLCRSLPPQEGKIVVPGIQKDIIIERDPYATAYIRAETDIDAFFALGYVHAQDRLWQMEINRRLASGRLSEILGEKTLAVDKYARILGLHKNAEKAWHQLGAREKAILQAYVDGVNQWMTTAPLLPSEFLTFHYQPEPWTAIDSLSWMQLMAWNLGRNVNDELLRQKLANAFGAEGLSQFDPVFAASHGSSSPTSDQRALLPNLAELQQQFASLAHLDGQQIGSNNWVLSGKYTKSGKPLLANDPHFQTSSPTLMYVASLRGDHLNVTGATFPGLPFVAIGRNQHIAWGATNMGADVQDLSLLKTHPVENDLYEIDGAYQKMEKHQETIYIRHAPFKQPIPPVTFYARSTVFGPVISDAGSNSANASYSVQWAGQEGLAGSFSSLLALNYANNWDQFLQAFEHYEAPAQNYVYADENGNIGQLSPGKIPLRQAGDGSVPTAGWLSKYKWQAFIPFDELPKEYNPVRGYIATANNDVTPIGYRYNITRDWEPPYRVNRIASMLDALIARGSASVDDMKKIQGDTLDLYTQKTLPLLLKLTSEDEKQQQALTYLRNWNGDYRADSIAATIYQSWIANFYRMMLESSLKNYPSNPAAASLLTTNLKPALLLKMLEQPETFDCHQPDATDSAADSCHHVLSTSLDYALADLSTLIGSTMQEWKWGNIHTAHYPHIPFSQPKYSKFIPPTIHNPLSFIYHRKIDSSGSPFSINVAPPDFNNKETPFIQLISAAYRQINDMGDKEQDVFILSTGQSGNVLSQHYDDQMEMHRDMKYIPIFAEKRVKQLTLTPEGK